MDDDVIKPGYTRVSDILKPFSKYDDVSPHILELACVRGTFIHKVIAGRMMGLGDPEIPKKWEGYIKSYEHWCENGAKNLAGNELILERRFYCDEFMITGQVDLFNGVFLIDFKTSKSFSKSWGPQVGAYMYLLRKNGHMPNFGFIVHLDKEGGAARVYEYGGDIEWELFKKCYDCYTALIK